MPTLKYKDGNTWKEFSLFGNSGGTGAVLVNITGEANATIEYSDSQNIDKGTVKLNNNGLGSVYIFNKDNYVFKDPIIGLKKEINGVIPSYEIDLRKYFCVRINTTIADPNEAVTYVYGAEGSTPGWDTWKDTIWFKNIKPCVLKEDGTVNYYLNRDNYTLKEDGTASVLNGNDGNVMVEFPIMGYKFEKEDNYVYISITTEKNMPGFCYNPFSLNAEGDCDKIYIGAYHSSRYQLSYNTYKYQSISGGTQSAEAFLNLNSMSSQRTWSSNIGLNWEPLSFSIVTLLQILFIMIYKSLDHKSLGAGNGYTAPSGTKTGSMDKTAFCSYGNSNPTTQAHLKFLGLEDLWGNSKGTLVKGIYISADAQIYLKPIGWPTYTYTKEEYPITKSWSLITTSGQTFSPSKAFYDNEAGFFPVSGGGSTSTYFCSIDSIYANGTNQQNEVICFGGGDTRLTGQSVFALYNPPNGSSAASRLVYYKEG